MKDMNLNDALIASLARVLASERQGLTQLGDFLAAIQTNHSLNERLPELRNKLVEHMDKTRQHVTEIRQCVKRLDGQSSEPPVPTGSGAAAPPLGFSVLDHSVAAYAGEHRHIALYTLMAAIAQELGDEQTMHCAEQILSDEQEMAGWLTDELPGLVQEYLRLQE